MARPVHTTRCSTRRTAGLTLPEVLIASVVLAGATLGLTHAVTSGHQLTDAALRSDRAMTLVESMIDEAMTLAYAEPDGDVAFGPDAGETTRDTFDDIDDLHGYIEPPGTLVDVTGALLPENHQRFRRGVSVTPQTISVPALGGAQTGKQVTATVTVVDSTGALGRSWVLSIFVPEPPA